METKINNLRTKKSIREKMRADLSNLKEEYLSSKRNNKIARKTIRLKSIQDFKTYKKAKMIIRRDARLSLHSPKNNLDSNLAAKEKTFIDNTPRQTDKDFTGIDKGSGDFTTCLSGDQVAYLRKVNKLPKYTKGEEIFNSVTHIVGGGFGVIFLIVGVVCAAVYLPSSIKATGITSMAIFGFCAVFLYTMSAIYHGLHVNKAKKVFQIIDHCTIYVLIAGTYVPICLMCLSQIAPYNYIVLGGIILLAALGIALNGTMMDKMPVKIVSNFLYLIMGWTIICFYPYIYQSLGTGGVWLLIGGGISYTVGAIFYAIGKNIKYFHSIFHLFVNLGTLLQFLAILLYYIIFPAIGI